MVIVAVLLFFGFFGIFRYERVLRNVSVEPKGSLR